METELLEIIQHYGLRNQLKKLSEEIYEFQEAILMDDGSEEAYDHICEERADIEVLLRQFEYFLDIKYDNISKWMVKKINRTRERILNEEDSKEDE